MKNNSHIILMSCAILIVFFSLVLNDFESAFCKNEVTSSDENPASEWKGESGYCNCLLVTMCRVQIRTIELRSDSKLPDLEKLATTRKDTSAWIRTQGFDYSRLDSKEVIQILMNSAGLNADSEITQNGSIETIDLVGTDGPEIKRKFNLNFTELNGVWILQIELEA
jgi:hypothetical protein